MVRRDIAPGVARYRVARTDWGLVVDRTAGRLGLLIGCAAATVLAMTGAA